jgi:hypothetical protein
MLILTIVATVTTAAHAQFGIGMSPGMQCPYPYAPGNGAINGNDEIANLQGQMRATRQRIDARKERLSRINGNVTRAKAGMGKVLSSGAITAIDEHCRYTRNAADYQSECSAPDRSASAGGEDVDAVNLPGSSVDVGGDGLTPVPAIYCYKGTKNVWASLVGDGGRMGDSVCDYKVPFTASKPNDTQRSACVDGLHSYYEAMDEKVQLETEIAELDGQLDGYEKRMSQIQDQITEGTYCPQCNNQRRSLSNGGTMDWLGAGVAVLGLLGNMYQQNQQRQMQQQQMQYMARLGYPPGMMPMQRPPMMGPMMGGPQMFPGPSAFPGNPYSAPMPGFMGMNNGMYGMGPGSMGPGAFGCQGTSPMGMQNPYANPFDPFMNSQANPFANPYMNNGMNPYMQNPMFNPGYGPGFMPMLGNGMQNPYMMNNPYGNMMGLNNPYMNNPYAPWGSPYYNGMNNPYAPGMLGMPGMNGMYPGMNGMYPPGMMPYNGMYPGQFANYPGLGNWGAPWGGQMYGNNPWANNPYAPGVLPYQGGNPNGYNGLVNYGGLGNNPWGAPYVLSPVQNFYGQIEQLKQQINVIQNGAYYGGGMGAPPILPMPNQTSPIYNNPGGPNNPVPVSQPPTNSNPIQIR